MTRALAAVLAAGMTLLLAPRDIVETILQDRESFYYVDAAHYPLGAASLPIGVFDSGTGGLTVLREVVDCDRFHNATHALRPGGDGRPDFEREAFSYLVSPPLFESMEIIGREKVLERMENAITLVDNLS